MLRIAIQSRGRLYHECLTLLKRVGVNLTIREENRPMLVRSNNFPAEVLFLEKDHIPAYVQMGKVDIGIVGEFLAAANEVPNECIIKKLGFDRCSLSLAIPQNTKYKGLEWFIGKTVATPYPTAVQKFFKSHNIRSNAVMLRTAVASAPKAGLADAVCDRVDSGTTLRNQGLKVVDVVMKSEACLIMHSQLNAQKDLILEEFLARIDAAQNAKGQHYVMMNVPNQRLNEILTIIPAMHKPSMMPIEGGDSTAVHTIIDEKRFWDIIGRLKEIGANDIVLIPVEKIIP